MKKQNWKNLFVCLLALMMAVSMAACSSSKSSTSEEDKTTVVKEETAATQEGEEPTEEELDAIILPNTNQFRTRLDEMEDRELADKLAQSFKKIIWCYINGQDEKVYEAYDAFNEIYKEVYGKDQEAAVYFQNQYPVVEIYGKAVAAIPAEKREQILSLIDEVVKGDAEKRENLEPIFLEFSGEVLLGTAGNNMEIQNLDDFKDCYGTYYDWSYGTSIQENKDGMDMDQVLEKLYNILMD